MRQINVYNVETLHLGTRFQMTRGGGLANAHRHELIHTNREEKVVLIQGLIRSETEIEAIAVPKLMFYL